MSTGKRLKSGLVLVMSAVVMFSAGCDDDDGGSAEVGSITVQGNISDFDSGAAVAAGVKAGITVKLREIVTDPDTGEQTVEETEYSTTTADDGTFVISGVVPGEYTLIIKHGGTEVEYSIGAVLDNTRVEVNNVTVRSNGQVIVKSVVRVDLGADGTEARTTIIRDDESESDDSDDDVIVSNPASVGDFAHGGVVFYIFQVGDNGYVPGETHGLVCAVNNEGADIGWRDSSDIVTGATGTDIGAGAANTDTIVAAQGAGSYAAKVCSDLSLNGFDDWYLPSKDELNEIRTNRATIEPVIIANGGSLPSWWYWSSSEINVTQSWGSWLFSSQNIMNKTTAMKVRPVRSF